MKDYDIVILELLSLIAASLCNKSPSLTAAIKHANALLYMTRTRTEQLELYSKREKISDQIKDK